MLFTPSAFDNRQQEMSWAMFPARLLHTWFLSPARVRGALSSRLAHTVSVTIRTGSVFTTKAPLPPLYCRMFPVLPMGPVVSAIT